MRNWFHPHPAAVDGDPAAVGVLTAPTKADIDTAYQQGRDRERSKHRHKGSPIVGLLVLLAVVIAGGFLYLAARHGSFSGGGAVIDRNLDSAAHAVNAPIKNAALNTGAALQRAGEKLK